MQVTVNTLRMARYKLVVYVGKDLYEGEERSSEDKAIASAARVALGNLGYDNESHISNDAVLSKTSQPLPATQFRSPSLRTLPPKRCSKIPGWGLLLSKTVYSSVNQSFSMCAEIMANVMTMERCKLL